MKVRRHQVFNVLKEEGGFPSERHSNIQTNCTANRLEKTPMEHTAIKLLDCVSETSGLSSHERNKFCRAKELLYFGLLLSSVSLLTAVGATESTTSN